MPPKKPPPKGGDDDDEDNAQGIALLLQTVYQEAFAYQSIKIIKIPDWRLTCEQPVSQPLRCRFLAAKVCIASQPGTLFVGRRFLSLVLDALAVLPRSASYEPPLHGWNLCLHPLHDLSEPRVLPEGAAERLSGPSAH